MSWLTPYTPEPRGYNNTPTGLAFRLEPKHIYSFRALTLWVRVLAFFGVYLGPQ